MFMVMLVGMMLRMMPVGIMLMMMLRVMLMMRIAMGLLFRLGMRLVGLPLLLGMVDRGWAWWLVLLTIEVAGLITWWLADGEDVADGGLEFALDIILHDFRGFLLWLGHGGLNARSVSNSLSLGPP